ncbi:MAG: hypothetical protein WDA37_03615 [Dysgonamonadaceae bacterium]
MNRLKMNRLNYFFTSTKGLILVAIVIVSVTAAIFGMLSGPMAEWGVRDVVVKWLRMDLKPTERAGRIIMLYHTIAMAVIAIEVYMITSIVPMKRHQQTNINTLVTFGYMITMVFGLGFAYWGHNKAFHGMFLVGLSLMFFAGVMLAIVLNPWSKEYRITDKAYAHTKKGIDLERMAFFTMVVMTLISAGFGAYTGSFWGSGQEAFLAEDIIREADKTVFEKSIIGHLHIMLALIAVAITLVIGRWFDFKGIYHKLAMWLMIPGSIVLGAGSLSVVWTDAAHIFVYVGAVLTMLAALFLVIFGWRKLIKDRLAEQNLKKAGFFKSVAALLHDPLKFGPLWQMVFMNFTVSGVGIFLAVKLDDIFRVWPLREERITLTGHWHILSALIATIIIMYYADISGLKGKTRQWFGWILIIGSDVAFASMTIFSMKRLMVVETAQQQLVDTTMILADFGLGIVLVMMFLFLLWRFFDLFKDNGLWRKETINQELDVKKTTGYIPAFSKEGDSMKGGEK